MTNQSSANYEHPKCYLAGRGACHKTISLEHWMSKSLLRELGTTVAVKGLPGVPVGQAKVIGIGALGANILCKKHNSMLSNLDENALKFFNLRRRIDRSFSKPPFAQMIANYQVDGSLFERWILKALAGMVLSGAAEIDGQKIKSVFSMNTELLFDALLTGHLPEGRGLSLVVSKEEITAKRELQCDMIFAWNDNRKIVGGGVTFLGQRFEVVFDPDAGHAPVDRVVRPTLLQFNDGWRTYQIHLKYKRQRIQKIVRISVEKADWILRT